MVNVLFIDDANAAQYRKPGCSGKNTLSFPLKIAGEGIYPPFNGVLEKYLMQQPEIILCHLAKVNFQDKFRKIIFHLKLNYD